MIKFHLINSGQLKVFVGFFLLLLASKNIHEYVATIYVHIHIVKEHKIKLRNERNEVRIFLNNILHLIFKEFSFPFHLVACRILFLLLYIGLECEEEMLK